MFLSLSAMLIQVMICTPLLWPLSYSILSTNGAAVQCYLCITMDLMNLLSGVYLMLICFHLDKYRIPMYFIDKSKDLGCVIHIWMLSTWQCLENAQQIFVMRIKKCTEWGLSGRTSYQNWDISMPALCSSLETGPFWYLLESNNNTL